jgi:hypothetical protein
MAITAGKPSIRSASGRSGIVRRRRKPVGRVERKRRRASAAMVPIARLVLPDPEIPVRAVT